MTIGNQFEPGGGFRDTPRDMISDKEMASELAKSLEKVLNTIADKVNDGRLFLKYTREMDPSAASHALGAADKILQRWKNLNS